MYEIFAKLLKEKGVTPYQVSKATGVAQSSLSDWKNGKSKPKYEKMAAIAAYFGVSVDYLIGNKSAQNVAPKPSVPGSKWIPVLRKVAAGTPVEAVQDILGYEEIDAHTASQGEHFALQIKGQSMEPRIKDGDVVIVRRQDDCDTGDIAVALVNGDEATVKRIKKEAGGIMLIPNNPAYEPKFYTYDDVQSLPVKIIGKVVELRAKF